MFVPVLAETLQSKIILELFISAPLAVFVVVWVIDRKIPKKTEHSARLIQFRQDRWQRELRAWGVHVAKENIAPVALELERCQKALTSIEALILNYFVLMLFFGFDLFLLPDLHLAADLELLWKLGASTGLYLFYIVNNGFRYLHGINRLRQEVRPRMTLGTLRRRSMVDYRSLFFPLLIGITVLTAIVVVFITIPDLTIHLNINQQLAIAFLLALFAAGFGIVIAFSEIVIQQIVAYPRLFIDVDPTQAMQIDDMFRAKAIGAMQMLEILGVGLVALLGLSGIQSMIRIQSSGNAALFVQDGIIGIGIILIAQIVSAGYIMAGKLGGTISGWPWQVK